MPLYTDKTDSIVLGIGGVAGKLVGLECGLGCLGLLCFFSFVILSCFCVELVVFGKGLFVLPDSKVSVFKYIQRLINTNKVNHANF